MNMSQKKKTYLSVFFLLCSVLVVSVTIIKNASLYTTKYNPQEYKKKYLNSQWRVPNSQTPISDVELYTYAGYEYIHGENPILVNPEHPPLGKYLIGVSIEIFENQHIMSAIFAIAVLFLIFITINGSTDSILLASLGVFLTVIQSIFLDQITHAPQLDIFHLFFFLLMSFFIIRFRKSNKVHELLFAGFSFGLMLSIKVFLQTFIIMSIFLIVVLIRKNNLKKDISNLVKMYLVAGLTFTATYFAYFVHGGTFFGFLGVQRWIFEFYKNTSIDMSQLFGTYILLVMFNKWKFWSEGYPVISYSGWTVFWPFLYAIGIILAFRNIFFKKNNDFVERYFSYWVILYSVSLAFIPVFPRYFVLLFIPIIISGALYAKNYLKG